METLSLSMFPKPARAPQTEPSLFSCTPRPLWQSSHVGGRRARGVGRRKEVAEAVLGQVPVFVVVEGLSRELAEEVGAVPEAAGATVPVRGTAGGRQGLRAAAAVHAAVGRMEESVVEQREDKM